MNKRDLLPLCRKSLIAYAIAQNAEYAAAHHHRLIADALQRVVEGTCKRLMIMMPPRHGKSMLASEYFPAYYFGHHPSRQVIHSSNSQELVDGFGRKIRNQLRDELFQEIFPETRLSDDSTAANKFNTDKNGAYLAVGVGGTIVGRGAHLLLIDDPVKGREEADSELIRKQLRNWYTADAYTRLMKGGAIVLIQTRWHEDDLAGWLLREHAHENWEVICLPAILDEGVPAEPMLDIPGERALWPEFFPMETLLLTKETMSKESPRDWEALYMQRPRPIGGGEFKRQWISNYEGAMNSQGLYVMMLVDPSSGKRNKAGGKSRDYTTIWIIGLGQDENYYVLDCVRDRLNLTQRAEAVFRLHRKWKPGQVRYEQYGMQADIEHLKTEMNRRKYRFVITEVGGQVAKEDRIKRLIPLFQTGRVWMPTELQYQPLEGERRDLMHDFIEEEYLAFPVGRHDDMLDALARVAEPSLDTPWPSNNFEAQAALPEWGVLDESTGY